MVACDRRIIVAVDFGTTYTGVAWADTSRPEVQNVISQWPGTEGMVDSPKVPTELRRVSRGWQWGFLIPDSAKRKRLFKLNLGDAEPSEPCEDDSPLYLTKTYLSCLQHYFVKLLEKSLPADVVHSTPMDFVVTVPAIWSNEAKRATERAAAMAGFCSNRRIQLISEPEAAALHTLQSLSRSILKVGQRFVVCDAGGGTVDLISYEVTKTDKLRIKEVTEGTGGRCGSAMLNERFRRYLKQTHGERFWLDEKLIEALNDFETFKKQYTPKGDPLRVSVDPRLGLKKNRFSVPLGEMKMTIFEPIMKDVICLIEEQIAMAGGAITAVVLVGGLGQSKYLKARVKEAVGPKTMVVQPEDGWIAVVKGACIHGLSRYGPASKPVEVTSRVARRSFGISLLTKYNMLRHDPRQAFWSEKEQEVVVEEMCWFIQKGVTYHDNQPSQIDYQCDVPVKYGRVPQTEIDIFCNDDLRPPVHANSRTRRIAILSLDLSRIPESAKRAAGKRTMGIHDYYTLQGVIEARYRSALITYSVNLEGVTHDAVSIRYQR